MIQTLSRMTLRECKVGPGDGVKGAVVMAGWNLVQSK